MFDNQCGYNIWPSAKILKTNFWWRSLWTSIPIISIVQHCLHVCVRPFNRHKVTRVQVCCVNAMITGLGSSSHSPSWYCCMQGAGVKGLIRSNENVKVECPVCNGPLRAKERRAVKSIHIQIFMHSFRNGSYTISLVIKIFLRWMKWESGSLASLRMCLW